MWLEIIAHVTPDWYLGRGYHSDHGSFSALLTPSRRSIRGSSLTKSVWLSFRRVAHTECVIIHCQLLMEARSPEDLLSAGRNISGLAVHLTLISARCH